MCFTLCTVGLMDNLLGWIYVVKVKHGGCSLREYMYSCDVAHTQTAAETFISIFRDFHRVDRVTLPLLKTLDHLMSSGCFSRLPESERLSSWVVSYLCIIEREEAWLSIQGDGLTHGLVNQRVIPAVTCMSCTWHQEQYLNPAKRVQCSRKAQP